MIDQIKKWLSEQGFPLEMRTASEFREAGFEVTLSGLYTDQDTGKPREIDVVALDFDYVGVTRIAFIVECKSSKKPWLLLCDPDVLIGQNRVHSFAAVSKNAASAMVEEKVFEALLDECPWFSEKEPTGYSFRCAFSEKDTGFEATSGVAKATVDFVNSAKDYQQCVGFPVIVIDSPLVRCMLDKNGEIHCEEVTEGKVFFKYGLEQPFRTCIRIVSLAHLAKFVDQAWEVAGLLRFQLLDAEVRLWQDRFNSAYPAAAREAVARRHGHARTTEPGASKSGSEI
jgi:hypothetical protein